MEHVQALSRHLDIFSWIEG